MKKVWMCGSILAALMMTSIAQAAMEDPVDIVKHTTDEVVAKILGDRDALRQDPAKMYSLVSEYIFPHFDFPVMSQLVLGTNWKEADEASQTSFIEQFRKLLVRTYATALLEFSDQAISYPGNDEPVKGRTAVVKQEIEQTGSEPIQLGYRLHNTSGAWKVYDVSVDGVSLVKTYRASFLSIINDGGLASLIDNLATKNKEINQ